MTEIEKLLEDTDRLLAAATPGPWSVDTITGYDEPMSGLDDGHVISRGVTALVGA